MSFLHGATEFFMRLENWTAALFWGHPVNKFYKMLNGHWSDRNDLVSFIEAESYGVGFIVFIS